jgi:hypothetical protein
LISQQVSKLIRTIERSQTCADQFFSTLLIAKGASPRCISPQVACVVARYRTSSKGVGSSPDEQAEKADVYRLQGDLLKRGSTAKITEPASNGVDRRQVMLRSGVRAFAKDS